MLGIATDIKRGISLCHHTIRQSLSLGDFRLGWMCTVEYQSCSRSREKKKEKKHEKNTTILFSSLYPRSYVSLPFPLLSPLITRLLAQREKDRQK